MPASISAAAIVVSRSGSRVWANERLLFVGDVVVVRVAQGFGKREDAREGAGVWWLTRGRGVWFGERDHWSWFRAFGGGLWSGGCAGVLRGWRSGDWRFWRKMMTTRALWL